jgi:hypothetical protein
MNLSENEKTTVQAASASRMNMRREARNQLVFLSAQFLLGMAVNLIGQPSETTGAAHAVSTVLLGLHAVVAIGLVAGPSWSSGPPAAAGTGRVSSQARAPS